VGYIFLKVVGKRHKLEHIVVLLGEQFFDFFFGHYFGRINDYYRFRNFALNLKETKEIIFFKVD
jgi:hypothetical protein